MRASYGTSSVPYFILRGGNTSNGVPLPDNLSEVDFKRADLREADLSEANFIGADLSHANLILANFTGTAFSGVISIDTNEDESLYGKSYGRGITTSKFRRSWPPTIVSRCANTESVNLSKAKLQMANLCG